jgi:hypothetical protein
MSIYYSLKRILNLYLMNFQTTIQINLSDEKIIRDFIN